MAPAIGMKGTEICRRLRREPNTRETPIVIISAKPVETELLVTMQLGADDYIVKPFSLRDVVARVRSLTACPPGLVKSLQRRRLQR